MSGINYEPDGVPHIDPVLVERASAKGLHPVHVICYEPGAGPDDPGGVTFIAFTPFAPRGGDKIQLEDGSICAVDRVLYGMARQTDGMVLLVANVLAVRVSPDRAG